MEAHDNAEKDNGLLPVHCTGCTCQSYSTIHVKCVHDDVCMMQCHTKCTA